MGSVSLPSWPENRAVLLVGVFRGGVALREVGVGVGALTTGSVPS